MVAAAYPRGNLGPLLFASTAWFMRKKEIYIKL